MSVDLPRVWRPILEGARADAALASAAAVAARLRDVAVVPRGVDGSPPTLGDGLAGIGVALAYLEPGTSRPRQLLDAAIESAAEADLHPGLFGGLAGIGWAFSHVRSRAAGGASWEDVSDELDADLLEILDASPWHDDYDLINGLVGYGVYALERPREPHGGELVDRVVSRLGETARPADGGLTWWTAPELVPSARRADFPDGMFNLGVAHGVPGVVAVLARASASGLACAGRAAELLEGAVTWLLRQQGRGAGSRFPAWILPGSDREESRQAWCYGDPGVAATLLLAARCARRPDWEREAVALALHAAGRPFEESGVVDVSLCHGAAGLAHAYNRIFQATGSEPLRDAACSWVERAVEKLATPGGPGPAAELDPPDMTLLSGQAGAALALLAAATPREPEWDRLFLLSGPEVP